MEAMLLHAAELLQPDLDALFPMARAVEDEVVNGDGDVDVVEMLFGLAQPPRGRELRNETQSWFESSVEDLLESLQPPSKGAKGNAGRLRHMHGQVYVHGADITNHKRPKVVSSSVQGQRTSHGFGHWNSSIYERDHQGESSLPSSSQIFEWELNQEDTEFNMEGSILNEDGGENGANGMDTDAAQSLYLTDDLLHMVFSFLDQRSLSQAAMVCSQWRVASEHEDFWKSLHFGSKATQQQVECLCRRFPKAVDLSFTQVESVDKVARDAMHSLQFLEKLTVCKGLLTDGFFDALTNGCPALQNLTISDAVLGTIGGQLDIQIHHRHLTRLQVTECRVLRMLIRCPRLLKLSLRQTTMAAVVLICPKLLSLDVSSCHKLSDTGVRAAASSCTALVALNISQCSYVSDETVREICATCTNLQVLDASWCTNLSLQGVSMPMLRELRLNNCEGINSSSMAALSQCFMLETIQLDYCTLLTAVVLDLQRLQAISLSNCCKFVDLTLRCPVLVEVNITECHALNRIDISSRALKKLVLQKQQSLTTVYLQCPYLQTVDFTECESLVDSVCEVFSAGGGCPRLNSLTLDCCESLTKINLSSTTLTYLSLAGCRNIDHIDISCANLEKLYLDGCDHLSMATFAPIGLQSLNLGICPFVQELKIDASSMTSLELKGCGALSRASITCPKLLTLDASYCSEMDDKCLEAAAASCPLVQTLVLACCPSIGPAGLLSLQGLCNLTTLDLSYTFLTDLAPIFQTCPRLKVLRLLACKYLADSALDLLHWKTTLPELQELDLSYGSLGQAALEGLLRQCPHLTIVSLNGCANLNDLDWERESPFLEYPREMRTADIDFRERTENFASATLAASSSSTSLMDLDIAEEKFAIPHALRQLNCVGCPNIKRVVIPLTSGFDDLSSLNFSLSNNIKEVRLECSYLLSLNLSHCTALEKLDLKCPRLLTLSLQDSSIEANVLEAALQGCSALETLDIRNCSKLYAEDLFYFRLACPRLKRLVSTMVI